MINNLQNVSNLFNFILTSIGFDIKLIDLKDRKGVIDCINDKRQK